MTYVPGKGPCYRCLFPEPSTEIPNCATAGVLGVLPGVLGTLQATEAIKLVVGIGEPLLGRLLTYDALDLRFREFSFKRRVDCAVCGDHPTIKSPQDLDRIPAAVRRLSPAELAHELERNPDLVLVDVRDPQEFASGHLPGARNIPVGELDRRLPELEGGAVVFVCLSGARSLAACTTALAAGVAAPATLEGGMRAWNAAKGR
jgi:adenylyltransferase/sulfurtransferase